MEVAKVLPVVMKRCGGQAQFSPMTAAVSPLETAITRVQKPGTHSSGSATHHRVDGRPWRA